jgi:hypothetical protein
MNAQLKIVSENKQTVQDTLDILKTVFPMNVCSKIMTNDRDLGYHCLLTVNPEQVNVEVKKQ